MSDERMNRFCKGWARIHLAVNGGLYESPWRYSHSDRYYHYFKQGTEMYSVAAALDDFVLDFDVYNGFKKVTPLSAGPNK